MAMLMRKPGGLLPAGLNILLHNKRFYDRLPLTCRMLIFADDPKGGKRCLPGRCINITRTGVMVETSDPLLVDAQVQVHALDLGLMGAGSVRHCTIRGSRFRIGIHFPHPMYRDL
jgi:hypothetical protein